MKKDRILVIVVIIILFILLLTFLIIKKKEDDKAQINNKVTLVDDYSTFFTVEDCINRYIDYISDGETNRVLNVLNEDYKKENQITDNNVINVLDTLYFKNNINYFKSLKMYSQKINAYTYKFYVYGKVYRETEENDFEFISDYYIVVTINNNQKVFDITPYDGKEFKEGIYE